MDWVGSEKHQIAIRFAYLHQNDFDIVYWLRANDWNTLLTSYVEMSRDDDLVQLGAPKLQDVHDAVTIAEALKAWLERENGLKWLVIFDNADKIHEIGASQSVVDLIPRGQNGCVLATSRSVTSDGELARAGCEVKEMEEDEATQFLLQCSRHAGSERDEQDAKTLVKTLGCLPLAIEQAGSFIRNTRMPVSEYISLYAMNKSELLKEELPLSHRVYYHETVATTWKVSFTEVNKQDPLASELLRLMTFFDGAKIPKELFEAGSNVLTDNWKLFKATLLHIERSLPALQSYSLVRTLTTNDVAIHILVQDVVLEELRQEASVYFDAAMRLVSHRFPWGGDRMNRGACLRYLAQGRSCTKYGVKFENNSDKMVWLLDSLGSFLNNDGQYSEAISCYERALKIKEQQFGVDHISLAATIIGMGNVYSCQGKYVESISCCERACKIYEREFGVDCINSAETIMGKGNIYYYQGRYVEAMSCYKRALDIKEREFGVDHIDSASTIQGMGNVYNKQGKYMEAMSCHERALKITERKFGVNHVNSKNMIIGMGNVYDNQGKYVEAMSCYERALRIEEREFGVDHINTASTIMGVSNVYNSQGKYVEAMSCHVRALKIKEREFGVDHINSADTIENMGNVFSKQGRYAEAMSCYERALKIREREFGVNHINSADTTKNMGSVYNMQGNYMEAMSCYERALKIEEREFGVDHVNSAAALYRIGVVYKNMGDWMSAKSYFERATSLYRLSRGEAHEFTIDSERQLASVIDSLNNDSRRLTKQKWWKIGRRK